MSKSNLVVAVFVCALMVAAPAGAVEYFFDDFNDNDMSDWTDLEKEVRAQNVTRYGSYGYAAIGQSATMDDTFARASKPLSISTLADTVYFSFDFIHTGGHMGAGSLGAKTNRIYLVIDNGEGYGIYLVVNKGSTEHGEFGIIMTDDFGVTPAYPPIDCGARVALPSDYIADDDYSEHTVGFAWDRVNAYMYMYIDGT